MFHDLFCIFQPEYILFERMGNRSDKMTKGMHNMKIPGMKARYLRLDRFLRMTDNLENQPYCPVCRTLADQAEKLSQQTVQSEKDFPDFEQRYISLYGEITEHLKTSHGYRLPNYYLSLYTLIYMIVGTLAGLFIVYLGHAGNFGAWSFEAGGLLGLGTGLTIGRITGHKKDKKMQTDHKTLY